MKRSVLGLMGCMVATMVFAQDPVYSVNVVGFNKHTFEKGKLYLVATAFEDIDGNVLQSSDVIGDQLPLGTQVFYYEGIDPNNPYIVDAFIFSGWGDTIDYHGFMGFWIKVPDEAHVAPSYDVVFKGQAPMDSTISNVVANGLNMLGYPFTADVPFNETDLYATSDIGDSLFVFNAATTNYSTYIKSVVFGWGAAEDMVIKQGMGFWYMSTKANPSLVTEDRPYPAN